jgi:hypothetical protein
MSNTQQLKPPRRFAPSAPSAPPPWWRRIGTRVLTISILVHMLFALIAGYFIVRHFEVKQDDRRIILPPSPQPRIFYEKPSSSPRHITTVNPDSKIPVADVENDAPPAPVMPIAGPGTQPGAIGVLTIDDTQLKPTRPFGGQEIKDGLTGRFYDLKQDRARRPTGLNMTGYADVVKKYVAGGWQDHDLARFYSSGSTLGIYNFFIPNMDAAEGPSAFRMEKKVTPTMWLAHYGGTVIAPETGRYHFVGAGDDVMLVGFNGQLVLDRCWNFRIKDAQTNYHYGYTGIPDGFARGDAIDVVKGRSYPIDVLIGEQPGGKLFAFLLIEKEGETYAKDSHDNPILPVFRVKNAPLPVIAAGTDLPPYNAGAPEWSVWRIAPAKR